jgi:hypothetical protein
MQTLRTLLALVTTIGVIVDSIPAEQKDAVKMQAKALRDAATTKKRRR